MVAIIPNASFTTANLVQKAKRSETSFDDLAHKTNMRARKVNQSKNARDFECFFPNFVQLVILLGTFYCGIKRLQPIDVTDTSYKQIFLNAFVVGLIMIGVIVIKYLRHGYRSLPKFDTVYSFYLPFMTSLLFDTPSTVTNTILILSVLNSYKWSTQLIVMVSQFSLIFFNFEAGDRVENIISVIINILLSSILKNVGQLKSLDNIDSNLFSILLTNILYISEATSAHFRILRGTILALVAIISINYMLKKIMHVKPFVLSILLFVGLPVFTNIFIHLESGRNPLFWLVEYILESTTRQKILFAWFSILILSIPSILIEKESLSLNTSRKLWHFIIFSLIVPSFQIDSNFVKIALSGTIPIFLSIEYIRFQNLPPLGSAIESQLRKFADTRDHSGPLIISYLYLLFGISGPLLINNSPMGLIGLGIGDSLASIIGKRYGRIRWRGTQKTMEGTLAFITTSFIVCLILLHFDKAIIFNHLTALRLLCVCTLSGVLEGNSVLNDNILIPTFMMICEKLFTL
ncbi:sec59p [Saccharomyces arboricola H-6]|uniref:dolichol kinase n=1 Tax=Saccharomyces arboricola (strain H-6 / AS 2.3317 / CBS 10644) TaxID=1160507 RepID=J8Q494_SACAR|nr:sec59p [Saccharomyces arboricola H-6]